MLRYFLYFVFETGYRSQHQHQHQYQHQYRRDEEREGVRNVSEGEEAAIHE